MFNPDGPHNVIGSVAVLMGMRMTHVFTVFSFLNFKAGMIGCWMVLEQQRLDMYHILRLMPHK